MASVHGGSVLGANEAAIVFFSWSRNTEYEENRLPENIQTTRLCAHFNKNLELNAKATCELWRRQIFTANFALMCSTSVNDHSNLLFWSDVTISHSLPSQMYDFTCMLFHHLWFGFEQHKNDGVQPFWTLNKLNKAKNQLELKNPTEWHLGTEIISHPHFQKWRVEFQPEWSDHFHRTNKFYFIKIGQANQKLCYFLCGVHQTLTIVTWTSDLNTPVPYKYEFPLTGFYQGFSRV